MEAVKVLKGFCIVVLDHGGQGEEEGEDMNLHTTKSHEPIEAPMYMETRCPDCDRLKAELAAAREANAKLRDRNCNDNGCEYVQKAHTMHNALVQALAAKNAELAKLRALCAARPQSVFAHDSGFSAMELDTIAPSLMHPIKKPTIII